MLTHLHVSVYHPPGGAPLARLHWYEGDEQDFHHDFSVHARDINAPDLQVLMGDRQVELLYKDQERSEYHCWLRGQGPETVLKAIQEYQLNTWSRVPMGKWLLERDDVVLSGL